MIYRLCANVLIIGAMVSVLAGRDTAREPNTTSKKKKKRAFIISPVYYLLLFFHFFLYFIFLN